MSGLSRTIALAAGGTGGHVFPASALAAEMHARGWRVVFITDRRGGAVGAMAGVETYQVRAGGVAGKSVFGRLRSIVELAIGTLQARKLLRRLAPDVVVGFGGYASAPTMMAATFGGYKTAIHEQNAVLGRANRLLAGRVDCIATSYGECRAVPPASKHKVLLSGMPVRPEIAAMHDAGYPDIDDEGPLGLLVLGGSQGARVLSEVVPAAIGKLDNAIRYRLRIVQQCRAEDIERVRAAYRDMEVSAELHTFFGDVPQRLSAAHLLIARAGASTVAEALAVGRPSVLVPYPHAVDDHQSANAHAVAEAGAGWMMDQSVFTPENLAARLGELFASQGIIQGAAACARKVGLTDAARCLADMVEGLVGELGYDKHNKQEGSTGA